MQISSIISLTAQPGLLLLFFLFFSSYSQSDGNFNTICTVVSVEPVISFWARPGLWASRPVQTSGWD